ncbi:MAG TPA: hypothetical protein VM221_11265 [Armatimonadota bacterium]|nr:hypothetical protein [Armatimonadota bacterium]
MEILAVLLPALGIGVIILMLVELQQWRAHRTLISGRQVALRMVGGIILLALLTAIFLGLYLLGLRSPAGRPGFFIAWWLGCLVAAIALIYVALVDVRHVEEHRREHENALWRDFARTLAERIRRERGGNDADTPDERA